MLTKLISYLTITNAKHFIIIRCSIYNFWSSKSTKTISFNQKTVATKTKFEDPAMSCCYIVKDEPKKVGDVNFTFYSQTLKIYLLTNQIIVFAICQDHFKIVLFSSEYWSHWRNYLKWHWAMVWPGNWYTIKG